MNNSDYVFDLVQRQRHEELMGEAAERRLAKSVRAERPRPAQHWWQRLGARPRPAGYRHPGSAPVRLQSARS